MFCFPLWGPSGLFNKLEEYWQTVKGHIWLGLFSLLLLHDESDVYIWFQTENLFTVCILMFYRWYIVHLWMNVWIDSHHMHTSTRKQMYMLTLAKTSFICRNPLLMHPEQITSDLWGCAVNSPLNGGIIGVTLTPIWVIDQYLLLKLSDKESTASGI